MNLTNRTNMRISCENLCLLNIDVVVVVVAAAVADLTSSFLMMTTTKKKMAQCSSVFAARLKL